MAVDVELALLDVIQQEGVLSKREAVSYLQDLKRRNRYMRDVY